ncbi:GTPase [Cellulomonas sp. Root137]|uniref:GTPase n=1 Tax=Cellulomonas sp. Root137 TaxID=1736459 RepID=UPI0006F9BD6A|nr:GTPase [Cellulomonas sp. Root137]KQY44510.1 ABC transporter [Cellulomonas sp. Root137]KRD41517.1 ABC transporter [Cellulomonas sp. Root930]
MSTTTDGPRLGDDTAALTARVDALDRALAVGGARLAPSVVARVVATVDSVRERLELGVDHTVVALVGGTGSGKSSLFNAICGLDFADVGVRRPTTSEITACVWGDEGGPLLDWLGVVPDRRIERESLLDGESEAPLRGLVLLDLPDHDSIAPEHREVVDRLLPQADLLAWVVDPQKYADDALHSGYLRRLVGHESSMVVVLNQVDTVPPDVRPELVADVEHLLVDDGLTGVPVREASARTGEGVNVLRELLATVVGSRSLAARRASAELNDAAALLAAEVAAREPAPAALSVTDVVDRLSAAIGLPAVASGVGSAVRGRASTTPGFGAVQEDAVGLARSSWLDAVTPGLPRRWGQDVASRVASTTEMRLAVTDALTQLTLSSRRSSLALGLTVAAVLLGGAAVLVGSIAVGSLIGAGEPSAWAAVVAVVLVVACVVAAVGAGAARRAAARRRSARVLQDGRAALENVARARLAVPTETVLSEHRTVRELIAGATG